MEAFGFRLKVNCVKLVHTVQTEAVLPLMEKADIRRSYTRHDPDEPAHVARPGSQLPQHQPEETRHRTYTVTVCSLWSLFYLFFCCSHMTHHGE